MLFLVLACLPSTATFSFFKNVNQIIAFLSNSAERGPKTKRTEEESNRKYQKYINYLLLKIAINMGYMVRVRPESECSEMQ